MCQSVSVTESTFAVGSEQVAAEGDSVTVVTIHGEIDAHTADQVRSAVDAAISPGTQLVVDLSRVTFMDSTGLGVFVTALKHLRENEGSLDLIITSPRVMKVFELTGLDVVIPIHEDREAALAR